jgi:hypothetical protein
MFDRNDDAKARAAGEGWGGGGGGVRIGDNSTD